MQLMLLLQRPPKTILGLDLVIAKIEEPKIYSSYFCLSYFIVNDYKHDLTKSSGHFVGYAPQLSWLRQSSLGPSEAESIVWSGIHKFIEDSINYA